MSFWEMSQVLDSPPPKKNLEAFLPFNFPNPALPPETIYPPHTKLITHTVFWSNKEVMGGKP